MPRPSNTDARRAQIVDGLLTVMADVGYEHATIAAIARAAGIASGLVHYHFENKQAILVALVERLTLGLEERVSRRLARVDARTDPRADARAGRAQTRRRGGAPQARLHAFVDALVARGKDADPRAVAAWVVVGAEAVRLSEVRALYKQAVATLLARLEAEVGTALEAAGRKRAGARRIAAALLAAATGSYQLAVGAPGLLPPGFARGALARMADGLVAAEPRA